MPRTTTRTNRTTLGLVLALLLALGASLAQAEPAPAPAPPPALSTLPGYVDPATLGLRFDVENLTVEVNLEGPLIQFVAEAAKAADPDLAKALAKIERVFFRLYKTLPTTRAGLTTDLGRAAEQLSSQGWQRVVWVRQEKTQSYLLIKPAGSRILGLTALFLDTDQQVGFINIAGEIDPAQIGTIAQKLDLAGLKETGEIRVKPEDGGAPAAKPPRP